MSHYDLDASDDENGLNYEKFKKDQLGKYTWCALFCNDTYALYVLYFVMICIWIALLCYKYVCSNIYANKLNLENVFPFYKLLTTIDIS